VDTPHTVIEGAGLGRDHLKEMEWMSTRTEDSAALLTEPGRRSTESTDSVAGPAIAVPELGGEMFLTVFGHLQGVYTWECGHVPSEGEIREALAVRVVRDASGFRRRHRCTELTGWHGGWTAEGTGIFTTDFRSTSFSRRTRHLGRATVTVHTPNSAGWSA
jgi:hypothetical protein